ncbi:MAG: UDP-galactopyranose mutase [Thermodesulfobacteriaceae bacterium]|nr:UDP-galactopyranose mutase [Thermodesulfobacteriaceae bacterium]MCX8041458.1 UDP-galactopyranose mutase [Thermodesulfobacteriaceae bacterium]MDW8135759.1 UDP-galactopyranose mutase [Thermodesulfobacterium sp.]
MFDYIVVGAGLAGSVLAERIANQLNKKVLVVEKRFHIGGNCYDFRDSNGIIVHKYGPHLFHTSYKDVFDYLSNFTEWQIYHHKVLAFIDGKKVPIPFNFNSMDILFPKWFSEKLQQKLINNFNYGSKVSILELKKVGDQDLQFLYEFIYNKLFLNYTRKQWERRPEEIAPEVIARVPILIGRDDRYFQDIYQVIPKEGYTKIFERMLNHSNIKLLLNTDFREVFHIDLENRKIFFMGNEYKGKVIYTGMIDELFGFKFGFLPYRSLRFEFKSLEKEYFQEVATVNYPNEYDFTRITEFKHIHPVNSNKTTIAIEYPDRYTIGTIPYYPVFTLEAQSIYEKYKEFSYNFKNLILVGRLAEYKYYDMDDVIKRALEIFENEKS